MMAPKLFRSPFLRHLRDDCSGVTLVEFAFVGPVLIIMIMGLFDMAHSQYTVSLLQGALQKAGRDITLQNASLNEAAIDELLRTQVRSVIPPGATIDIQKESFFDFSNVNQAETLTNDANGNGFCNTGDSYIDANNNGTWDATGGKTGIGGARDVVLYSATATYPRMFPMAGLIGLPNTVTIKAATVLRNQPFSGQTGRSNTVRTC